MGGGGGGVQSHFHVKPNSGEIALRLSWGCDNIFVYKGAKNCLFGNSKKEKELTCLLNFLVIL